MGDDVLVMGYGESEKESLIDHDSNLTKLLKRARETNLKLNRIKLRQPEVKCKGHVITNQGLKPDQDKVKAVKLTKCLDQPAREY